jgi:murein DD-endopeptidase MepM/ murein hydrolase activator NlpD
VPPSPRSGIPGPLDNLPRPLDERGRHGRRGRARGRLLRLGTVALFGVGIAAALTILASRPAPSGEVAGIVATPGPSAVTVAGASSAPRPVVVPSAAPSAAPTSSEAPVGNVGPPDPATLTGYQWPLPRGRETLPFGPSPLGSRVVEGQLFHDGLDLATFCGDRVVAAHDGTVLAASRHYDRVVGWVGDLERYFARLDKKKLWTTLPIVVVIDDGNGYRSMYAHFSKVVVKKGDVVKAGQFIGYEGATGRATGCHVHYGLFSPAETATFGIDPGVVKRMKVPTAEIARIDPLLVLPPRTKH